MQNLEIGPYFNWMKFCWVPKHTISYRVLGESNRDIVVCAHSSTTNSHEFDYLANELALKYRVILFDFVGRGDSSWLPLNKHYHYYVYIKDVLILLKKLACSRVHWIGTSMGGIVGMILAACFPKKIISLVLNDIGAEIPAKFISKIKQYLDLDLKFKDIQQVVDYGKIAYSRLGISTEEHWRYFALHIVKQDLSSGLYLLKHDPKIISDMDSSSRSGAISLWFWWRRVKCSVFLIRGSKSEALLSKTVKAMKMSNRHLLEEYSIPDTGHFPILYKSVHINKVVEWFNSQQKNLV